MTDASKYTAFTNESLAAWLKSLPAEGKVRQVLGEWTDGELDVGEYGDGNLNFVFLVTNKATGNGLVVKQALPYVRCIGESWQLPLKRAFFENLVLGKEAAAAPGLVPEVYLYDDDRAAIVMELLTPHIILRKGLIAKTVYPHVAKHLGHFLAATLFASSDLALKAPEKRQQVAVTSGNFFMCELTEGVIFTDPYQEAEHNRHTSPQLDDLAAAVKANDALKLAVAQLKNMFINQTEALIHGDLHTGSVMVTEQDTRVIDPEFGFYGPMGFDIGAIVGNFFLALFAQQGLHPGDSGPVTEYQQWIAEQIVTIWDVFAADFVDRWTNKHTGDLYAPSFFASADGLKAAQQSYMQTLLRNSIRFAAAKIIRRILGVAHVEDLEAIQDADARAACERRAVNFAVGLLTAADSDDSVNSIRAAVDAALATLH